MVLQEEQSCSVSNTQYIIMCTPIGYCHDCLGNCVCDFTKENIFDGTSETDMLVLHVYCNHTFHKRHHCGLSSGNCTYNMTSHKCIIGGALAW